MIKFEKVSFEQYKQAIGGDADLHSEYDAIRLPQRATAHSAGYDFFSPIEFWLFPGESIKIPTGIRVYLANDQFLMCVPRSGLGTKYRMQLDNTCGIIDADYILAQNEGHIFAKVTNDSRDGHILHVMPGQAFMQGIILKYYVTDNDSATGKREGGLGSTDAKH